LNGRSDGAGSEKLQTQLTSHKRRPFDFAQRKKLALRQRKSFEAYEPPEGGPVAEPGRRVGGELLDGGAAGAEAGFDGTLQSFAFVEGAKDGELFPLETAEIHGVVRAMDGEIGGSGLEARDSRDLLAFLALGHGVAGNVGTGIVLDGEEKVVDGKVKVEQANERLKLEAKLGGICALQRIKTHRRLGGGIESFDLRPFQANHVESELLAVAGITSMFAKPGFEARAEIAHGERTRRAIDEIGFGKSIEAAVAENGAKTRKVIGEAVENAEPVLPIVDFEALERAETVVRPDDARGDFC
jgi:hypothetical protein